MHARFLAAVAVAAQCFAMASTGLAQTPPSAAELAGYGGLHAAAARGDVPAIDALLARGADANARDGHGRTPLHVAAHMSQAGVARALVKGGADPRALEHQRYDIVTTAAVTHGAPMVNPAAATGGDR